MKQFSKILKFELLNYLKNKAFVGSTVFLVLVIAVAMFIPNIISAFKSGEPTDSKEPSAVMLVKSESAELSETVKQYFGADFTDYDIRVTDADIESVKQQISAGDAECAFVMESATEYTYYVNNLSMYDVNTEIANEVLQNVYRFGIMVNSGLTPEKATEVMTVQINGSTESLGVDQMQNYWYTYIMIFALYMVIMLYGQMVATNVATEKSSRAMEVLITSARPVAMMFGKVLASCLAGFIQLLAVFGSALLFFNLNSEAWGGNQIINSMFDMPPMLLVYMLIFFVLGFLIYAFLYGAMGSTVSKLEDINTSVMPLTYIFIFAFIVVMFSMAGGSVDSILMRICSYIPFTSPMAMFTRIAMSTVPVYEIAISIAVLVGSVIGIGVLSAKIYRVGVLLYGNRPKIGVVLKMILKS